MRVGLSERVYIPVGRCHDPRVHKYVRDLVKHELCLLSSTPHPERLGGRFPRIKRRFLPFPKQAEERSCRTREDHLGVRDMDKSLNSPFRDTPRRALRWRRISIVGGWRGTPASAILKLLRLVRTSGTWLALWRRDAPRGPYLLWDNDGGDDDDRTREH